MRWLLFLLVGLGCKGDETQAVALTTYIADYHGLEEGASWAFRDDGISDESPLESEVLRARYMGDGILDFRRGSRWADARTHSMLDFDLDAKFKLQAWEFAGTEGEEELELGTDQPAQGQAVSGEDWFCATEMGGIGVTYYGIFEDIIRYDCEGDAGPAGSFIFALGVGLVHFESEEYTLDLIAPW